MTKIEKNNYFATPFPSFQKLRTMNYMRFIQLKTLIKCKIVSTTKQTPSLMWIMVRTPKEFPRPIFRRKRKWVHYYYEMGLVFHFLFSIFQIRWVNMEKLQVRFEKWWTAFLANDVTFRLPFLTQKFLKAHISSLNILK